MEPAPTDPGVLGVHGALRRGFATEAAVYGTILASGMVAVSSAHGESSVSVLLTVVVTVVVFWGAHVYAGTVSRFGDFATGTVGFRSAFRGSFRESFGMLGAATVPCILLAAGTTRLIPDDLANDAALWSGVAILASLGYIAFAGRGAPRWQRALGALGTASFGVVFVLLKAFVH